MLHISGNRDEGRHSLNKSLKMNDNVLNKLLSIDSSLLLSK
ncbi:unnamed protein product, partial [Didymodactylos carnosus]